MERVIDIKREDYAKAMINIINCFFNMTKFEIKLISTMVNNNTLLLDKTTRLDIRNLMNTSEYNFNNYIKKLKSKQVLMETSRGLEIQPVIVSTLQDRELSIKFNIQE